MARLSQNAEEILESLWVMTVEGDNVGCLLTSLNLNRDTEELVELIQRSYVEIKGDRVYLRREGRPDAQMTVRRHRLAERLTMDILGISGDEGNEQACEFEHLLRQGVDTKLCTLLNHPTTCPHGNPIPPGECCIKARQQGEPGIVALTELKSGESGEIAYLSASDDKKMQKLMSMGVLPGSQLLLVQKFPSYIFKVGQSQFAVDDTLAREIHVRRPV
ncbi:DtxR family transcriptional regulator, Mn-dependent transcriptional regulator [Desulfuromusa kysingii]|uniref:DtxR family transcriptional regulator, Mn-dependent transcriptional regulator n=1 Tax=Desulfuromusa kysingii TaxID=37625 RepID=A0A1H4C298_9BACT|nr:metal-dependent transcriptional regulator [Desulfuromusa kysingii]SEA54464.1 DtxR family transcriptional regulator, Mn-dependent transcriptional regulator [Desulfuromusa kysingii]